MDILYLVGPPELSKHGNMELRWSLRSVAKYARNVGRVIVCGYPPDWLSDAVVRHEAHDRPGEYKFRCVWRKLFAAIDSGLLKGEFLMSCDDHFYTAPVDLDATPFWYRRDMLPLFNPDGGGKGGGEGYRRHLAHTRRALLGGGYGARDCASHCNVRLDARDADAARALDEADVGDAEHWLGLDLGSVFLNARARREPGLPFAFRKDRKCDRLDADAVASGQFSISDEAFDDPAFVRYMEQTFPSPCVYERS